MNNETLEKANSLSQRIFMIQNYPHQVEFQMQALLDDNLITAQERDEFVAKVKARHEGTLKALQEEFAAL